MGEAQRRRNHRAKADATGSAKSAENMTFEIFSRDARRAIMRRGGDDLVRQTITLTDFMIRQGQGSCVECGRLFVTSSDVALIVFGRHKAGTFGKHALPPVSHIFCDACALRLDDLLGKLAAKSEPIITAAMPVDGAA